MTDTTAPTAPLSDPDPLLIEAGAPIALPSAEVAWEVVDGEAEVYVMDDTGRGFLAVLSPGDGLLPQLLPAAHRLQIVSTGALHLNPVPPYATRFATLAQDWLDVLKPEDTPKSMPSPESVFALADASLKQRAEEFAAARATQDARTLSRLSKEVNAAGLPSNRTETALRTVAEALNLPDVAQQTAMARSGGQVPALCRRVGLRAREVLLQPGWHQNDNGPLLVRLSDETAQNAGLDALIWDGRGYRGPDGTRLKTPAAEAYDRVAFTVSAPLPNDVTNFWTLAKHVLRTTNRRDAKIAAFAALIMATLGVLTPLAIVWLLSDIVPSGAVELLFGVGVALAVAAVFTTLLRTAQSLATTRIAGQGTMVLNAAVTDRLLRLPTSFFKDYAPGDLNQRIGHIDQMRGLIVSVAFSAVLTSILSVVYLAVLLTYDAQLALIAIGLVTVYIIAVIVARVLQRGPIREVAELDGDISALTYETLDGVAKLRASAAEDKALARWLDVYTKERQAQLRAGRISVGFGAFSDAYQTATLMVLFAGAGVLSAAEAPAGVFIGFLAAFGAFQAAFVGLSSTLLEIFAAQPLMDRARPILTAQQEVATGRKDPGTLRGEIEASGLTFAYQAGSAPVLDRLDFKVKPGTHMAIVGASGSGKSTLLRLLLGFEVPQTGTILYDGQELSHLDLTQVRSQIGVVLQASELFAGSILENIRGASDTNLEDCLDAARQAGLSRDLEYFAMGVHTPITEGAATLSGGQRQRILIARALAAKPNILFFDEATSALDNATQGVVSETLDTLSVTRITIAHRLSTVRHADQICVLQDGKFVEQGRFDDLMAQDGPFAALARRQLTEG